MDKTGNRFTKQIQVEIKHLAVFFTKLRDARYYTYSGYKCCK